MNRNSRDELREQMKNRFDKGFDHTFGAVIEENALWAEALELARDNDKKVAFRASWALTTILEKNNVKRQEFLPVILSDFLRSDNQSVLRSYGKLTALGLQKKEVECPPTSRTALIEKSLDLLIEPDIAPAVKVWAMEILYFFRNESIVKENFRIILRDILDRDPLPSLANKAGKMMKRLENRQ